MEIILAIAVASAVTSHGLKNAVVDITWALRGQPSPRRRAAAARPRTRGAFASYWAELWRDSWTDAHARHGRRRQRRQARSSRPQGAFRTYAGVVVRDGWRVWDRAWDNAAERRMARPRPVPSRPTVVVVPGETTPRSDLRFGPDEDPTGVRTCPTCDGDGVVNGEPCPECVGRQEQRSAHWDKQTPLIPDEAVEAAARATHEKTFRDDDIEWDDDDPEWHDLFRARARAGLEAALPILNQQKPTTEGNTMTTTAPTGEVTGLSTAITNATAAAASAEAWPPALEQFSAGLAASEVGEGVLLLVAQAQEQFAMAAATMRDVEAALTKQRSVQEAYQANPDAGNKQFVTND